MQPINASIYGEIMQAPVKATRSTKKAKAMLVGNWKMHGLKSCLTKVQQLANSIKDDNPLTVLCLPATLIALAHKSLEKSNTSLHMGAQDCHWQTEGAYTGDVSALMCRDSGASYVLLGHGERRRYYNDTNALVRNKMQASLEAGLQPIMCIGETKEVRQEKQHFSFIRSQLLEGMPENISKPELISIAYEPLWAIGTGSTPSAEEIGDIHGFIRQQMVSIYGAEAANIRLLYGGSVNIDNVGILLKQTEVNGVLVGGASLQPDNFLRIYDIIKKNLY